MGNLPDLHDVPLSQVFKTFQSSSDGLQQRSVDELHKTYGYNELSEKKKTPLLIRFLLQFKNFFSILLLVGAALAFISHTFSPNDGSNLVGYALVGVTVLNAVFTFIQEYKAQQAMDSFKNLMPQQITVVREGTLIEVPARELVPGDIIVLREGDKVPADSRIIEAHQLKVDHSMLTGESEPQLRSIEPTSKNPMQSRNMVFSGTLIKAGSGKAIVLATGDNTEIGRIANLTTQVQAKDSKIKRELNEFVKIISSIAIILGLTFFGLGFIVGNSFWFNIIFAIGIIVANVPEGLLPTVTLTLSIGAQKLAKKNALVKDIEAIETLGSVTTICTDKTGTLTMNELTVTSFYYNMTNHTYDQYHRTFYDSKHIKYLHALGDVNFSHALNCMYLCNNAVVQENHPPIGDPTEIALKQVVITQKQASEFEQTRREEELPFDSEKKYMIVAVQHHDDRLAYMKGSPESTLAKSIHYMHDGKPKALTTTIKKQIMQEYEALAKEGQRVLGLAYKSLDGLHASTKLLEEDTYVFLGFIALQDPPRPEVKEAVEQCYGAGIRIVIISGDNGTTVEAIGRQTGIITQEAKVLTSDDLAQLNDDALKELLRPKQPIIFARSLPQDKLRVVRALQDIGEIVAVTGDGVNDAPALKQADVGVAMGKSGTDVAKDAADIVLLDDNFATIVNAIKGGRTVFDNVKKFIVYILTSNMPEIFPFLFMVLLGWPLALPVLLILAIDLGTDMIPAISLGLEKGENDVMKQKPRDPKAKLMTGAMLARSYGVIGPLEAFFSFVMFFITLRMGGWNWGEQIAVSDPLYHSAVAAFFTCIVIIQIFNNISCRTVRMSALKKAFDNRMFFIGVATELALVALIVFFPPAQQLFGTAPFELWLLPFMVLGGIVILAVEEYRKHLFRTKGILGVD